MKSEGVIDIEGLKKSLQNCKVEIQEKYKAEILGIFGSHSRGEAVSNSDVDLLVKFEKGASLLDWSGLKIYLEGNLGVSVDVVPEKSLKKELQTPVYNDLIKI